MKTKKKDVKAISAEELDKKLEVGEDISEYFDCCSKKSPGVNTRAIYNRIFNPFLL